MKQNKSLNIEAKPFLRWAGGKRWFLKDIDNYLPDAYNNYHEVFVGGGSIFFHLPKAQNSFLSDLNSDLINTYIQIRDNVNKVVDELYGYKNTEKFYYEVRSRTERSKIKKAAQFIYLNRTSFNGIYRVNLSGQYNVPYGFRKDIDVVDKANLLAVSKKLQGVTLLAQDFGKALLKVKKGDLVFLDPPYTVAHENNGFISYNQKIFSLEDQHRLAKWTQTLNDRGAYYILTNAKHKAIQEIYSTIEEPEAMYRASTIGGVGAERKKISEYIFTNAI